MIKGKVLRYMLIFAVIIAISACTVFLLRGARRYADVLDREQKARASLEMAERKLGELEEKYDTLQREYLELEKVKAKERQAPVVYLTFDDGPSKMTERILKILDDYNVKATFFVTGKEGGYASDIYRRLVMDGHAVGNHTYSHEYDKIYTSADAFWAEVKRNDELFFECTGRHLEILRFPGGSNNTVSERHCKGIMGVLTAQAKERGVVYFDWNVSSGDAERAKQERSVIIDSVLKGCEGRKKSIVLMHDSAGKTTTADALPIIIEALLERGCVFRTLDADTEAVQFT